MCHQYHRHGPADPDAGLAEGVDEEGIQLYERSCSVVVDMRSLNLSCEEQQEPRTDSKVHDSIWIPTLAYSEERRWDMLSNVPLKTVHVIVDKENQTVHTLPLNWLLRTSNLFATWHAGCQEGRYVLESNTLHLKSICSMPFCDFTRWLFQNRITEPWCVEATYLVEATARRLIEALDLGIYIDCAEYQLAAMREFLALAPYIEWPEDYVNDIWRVTANWCNNQGFRHLNEIEKLQLMHPMRQMIVAIVAAQTVGRGKRRVMTGHRDPGDDTDDAIIRHVFWVKYHEYKTQNANSDDGACAMPVRVEWFL